MQNTRMAISSLVVGKAIFLMQNHNSDNFLFHYGIKIGGVHSEMLQQCDSDFDHKATV